MVTSSVKGALLHITMKLSNPSAQKAEYVLESATVDGAVPVTPFPLNTGWLGPRESKTFEIVYRLNNGGRLPTPFVFKDLNGTWFVPAK